MYSLARKKAEDREAKVQRRREALLARAKSDDFLLEVYGKTQEQLALSSSLRSGNALLGASEMISGNMGGVDSFKSAGGMGLGDAVGAGSQGVAAAAPPSGSRGGVSRGLGGTAPTGTRFGPPGLWRQPSGKVSVINENKVVTSKSALGGGGRGTARGFNIEGSLVSASVHQEVSRTLKKSASVPVKLDAVYPGMGKRHTPMNHCFRDRNKALEIGPAYINTQDRYRPKKVVRGGGEVDVAKTRALVRSQTAPRLWPEHRTINDGSPWNGGAKGLKMRERRPDAELAHNYMGVGGNGGSYDPTIVMKGGGKVDEEATRRLIKTRSKRRLRNAGDKWNKAEIVEDALKAGLKPSKKLDQETRSLRSQGSFKAVRNLRTQGSMRRLPSMPASSFREVPLTASMRNVAPTKSAWSTTTPVELPVPETATFATPASRGMVATASGSVRWSPEPDTIIHAEDSNPRLLRPDSKAQFRIVRQEAGEYSGAATLDHFSKSHWRPEKRDRWLTTSGWNRTGPGGGRSAADAML